MGIVSTYSKSEMHLSSMDYKQHFLVPNKANGILGCIKECGQQISIHTALVRPHLEYFVQLWTPQFKKRKDKGALCTDWIMRKNLLTVRDTALERAAERWWNLLWKYSDLPGCFPLQSASGNLL